LHLDALITIFTLSLHLNNNGKGKEMNKMFFGDKLKKEREKRGWSQDYLAEKIYVSRQSVSKWETGKNYPSIEVIIDLSDLFDITIDELLRSDEELKEKVIQDSKQLAHPNWKTFFDSLFLWFYVNCWGEVKVLTPIYYLVWFSFRRQFLPFRGRLMSLLRLTPCGVSSRPLLSQECQNYLRNDCLFFPLYPTRSDERRVGKESR